MKLVFKALFQIAFVCSLFACCSKNNGPAGDENGGKDDNQQTNGPVAYTYTTTADKTQLFSEKTVTLDKKSSIPGSVAKATVTIDPSTTYQEVDGFGAAMTWATCYNLQKMSKENRTTFLKELFDTKEGLGISLVRMSIGASDFNVDEYTWCDKKGIENFAMHESDKNVVIPIMKEVYAINPDVKIIASPWSAPRWMKRVSPTDNNDYYSWTSGSLIPEYYEDYATYFVKWIQVMQAEGFNIHALTIQNEPLNRGNSMSMFMGWTEQRDFIKVLGPALQAANLKTKILVFDHNYNYDDMADQKNYPLKIYADKEASKWVAGSAWHNYGGNVSELNNIVQNAPDKEIYFTEASIGTWNYNFESCLINDFNSIFMQTLSKGCKGVTLWNMVLDDNKGPYSPQGGSCKTCYGAVTMLSSSAAISERMSHYYNIAHASKVIKPGAVRIASSVTSSEGLSAQTYKNPDGSYGTIILNQASEVKVVTLKAKNHSAECIIPAKSITSVIWND
ncbi:MAG: glucosylceramidase [Bacteroidales bacterium]|nr:glucosylceramidase [Bacteroidales bacterium]